MKISVVRKSPSPVGESNGEGAGRWLLELQTDSNLSSRISCTARIAELALGVGQALLPGEDPRATAGHWRRMQEQAGITGQDEDHLQALAALDIALWDLKSRANNEPLWKTLGGARPEFLACAFIDSLDLADSKYAERTMNALKARGIRSAMLKLSGEADDDLPALRKIRDAMVSINPHPDLLLAFDRDTTPDRAIERLQRIEAEIELACVVAPDQAWDGPDMRSVSESTAAAVCAAPRPPRAEGLFLNLDHRDVDMLLLDPALTGVTGTLQLAEAAFGFELPVMLATCSGTLGAQLASVMPNIVYLQVSALQYQAEDAEADPRISDGLITAGDDPGVGTVSRP